MDTTKTGNWQTSGVYPTKPGRYAKVNGGWTEIATFGDRKNLTESEVAKALVTEKGNLVLFDRLSKLVRKGPTGNETALYDNIGEPIRDEAYSTMDEYRHKPPIVINRQFDSARNVEELMRYLPDPRSYGIASGRKPSGPCHFGHKLVIETISFFQQNGAQIFVPIADNEASLDPKIKNADQYRYFTADNLLDWGACGLDLDAAHIYLQSEEMRVMNISYAAARRLNLSLVVDTYGRETVVDEMNFLFASITQVGDILLPQHPDFGKRHSFMLSGADQDGHMTMTMALSKSMVAAGAIISTVPSSLYVKSVSNLEGNKESASEPETTIYLGPSRNVYLRTETGKVLENIRKLSLPDRILDTAEKVDRFNTADSAKVMAAIRRRKKLFKEFDGEKEIDVDRFKEITAEILTAHHLRRRDVYNYAILMALQCRKDAGEVQELIRLGKQNVPGFNEHNRPVKPSFWKSAEEAIVPLENRKIATKWFDMVARSASQLVI